MPETIPNQRRETARCLEQELTSPSSHAKSDPFDWENSLCARQLSALLPQLSLEPRHYQRRIVSMAAAALSGEYPLSNLGFQMDQGTRTDTASHREQAATLPDFGHRAERFEPAARSVLIESPTGSGKTIMGLLTARLLQERYGIRTGWVAMRRNLLTQTVAENVSRKLGVAPLHAISMFERNPPRDVDLLIVDEAQHDAAASMAHLHNTLRPRWIIGLTATPFRIDRVKLCFDKVLRDAGIHRLIQDGFLSPYDHYTIPEFSPGSVAEFYLREPPRWGKTIVFFRTLADCFQLDALLKSQGVASDVVTGQSDREAQIEQFRTGATPVLINCMVLTEGFDCPDLETVFCRDSSKGPTMQMCGRAFRKHPGIEAKKIVQSRLSNWPFTKVAAARQQWLWQSGEWRSLTVNPLINAVSSRVRLAIASSDVQLPELLRSTAALPPWLQSADG